jgi:AraC-like DNA-binding protein
VRAVRERLDVGVAGAHVVGEGSDAPWHFHREWELILILVGTGLRLVGDDVGIFNAGETVLLGPDVPHSWASTSAPAHPARAAVIHFGDEVATLATRVDDGTVLLELLAAARRGALIPKASPELLSAISSLATRPKLDLRSVARLLHILADLADCERKTLTSSVMVPPAPVQQRLETVRSYLLEHHAEPISLAEAAAVTAMSPAAFSRFFHRWMGQPFTSYLNELRVQHACTLLLTTDLSIAAIAAVAGFANLSNFNRRFRRQNALTPREYRARASAAVAPRARSRQDPQS